MDKDTEQRLNKKYIEEGWGDLAMNIGLNPVNTEGQARHVLRSWADEHKKLEMATQELIEKAEAYLVIVTGDSLMPPGCENNDGWFHTLTPLERINQVAEMLEGMT